MTPATEPDTSAAPITGACLCGAVTFEVDPPTDRFGHCHCWMCRQQHGAAFVSWAHFSPGKFRLKTGREVLKAYCASPERQRWFCTTCGGHLFASPTGELETGDTWVRAGVLNGDPGIAPQADIFVSQKAPWYTITSGLPQFPEFPPTS